MSVDMQTAYENDQAIITETEKIYIDNPNNNYVNVKIIDSNNDIDNTDINSSLSKLKELEKEEEIIENFEV